MYKLDIMNMVLKFHETFGVPILDKPQIPDYERCILRYNLIKEELEEFKKSIDNNDIVEVADALADMMYLIVGGVYEFGLGGVFNDVLNEVHNSNMSKACIDRCVAEKTIDHYKKLGVEAYYKNHNNRWIIYRSNDNKVLKSIDYSRPNIKNIIINKQKINK